MIFFRKEMLLLETLLIEKISFYHFFEKEFQRNKRKHLFEKRKKLFIFEFFGRKRYFFLFLFLEERKFFFKMIFKKNVLFFKTTLEKGIKLFEKSFSFEKANYRDLFYLSY